jgi:Domain of unknown function (DUF6851)/VCPO second helical-bundle domain
MTRRELVAAAGAGGAALLLPGIATAAGRFRHRARASADSVVLQWNAAALQAVRESRLGPPMVARALAIVHTCAYDAWAGYDRTAVGTQLGGSLRRPPRERTLSNKNAAITFAAYRAAVDLFPGSKATAFDPLMQRLGYDPTDASIDTSTAVGIGNAAAAAVLAYRHRDGSNQLGDEPGGRAGIAYSDYTGYAPANAPMDPMLPFDPSLVRDPNAWQPLTFVDATGTKVTPGFIAPHWGLVEPFALGSGSQLRSPVGPARHGSAQYTAQAEAVVALSAGLTDEQKTIAEYWADGPRSELPPGHWNVFAQSVSRRDHHGANEHGVDLDVKLFLALTNAIFDAGICCWDNKRAFDSERPITAIRHLFNGRSIRAWAGPLQGTQTIDGGAWRPYQPSTFPTPPFAEFSSGHSTFSAAGAEILRLFTGKDRFGATVVVPAGSSKVEPGAVPARDVTLTWPTFSDAADQAGLSRRYGGIHFQQGDLEGRAAGRTVARIAWGRAQSLFRGSGD